MVLTPECLHPGCQNRSLSFSKNCALHLKEKDEYLGALYELLRSKTEFWELNLSGLHLPELNLEGKVIYGSDFSDCRIDLLNLSAAVIKYCFFDFSYIQKLTAKNITSSLLLLQRCFIAQGELSGSDIIHTNFNGIRGRQGRLL
jgi:uncharacterized protein YjbI with pentapeptide repeats